MRENDATLPTRPEFARRLTAYRTEVSRGSRWANVLGFGLLVGSIGTLAALPEPRKDNPWFAVALMAGLSSYLVYIVVLSGRLVDRLARQNGLLCPHCGTRLTQLEGKLALTTGRCAGCGERVLAED